MYKVSPTANNPTATTTTSMPSSNSGMPKVNRACPVWLSIPIKPTNKPKNKLARPRKGDAPSTADTVVKANTITAKYSAGPNCNATSTTSGATKVSAKVASVPATNEPIAEVASAGPARPAFAIMFPSIAVAMVADSPGVLSRMDVVDPPYIAP